MAYYTDILDAIRAEYSSGDLDAVIKEYLDTPDNGFFYTKEVEYPSLDGVSTDTTTVQTSANTTVEQWKTTYLEEAEQDAKRESKEIVISDHNSPNYPVPDFDTLTDSRFTSGGLYYPSGAYVQYEFQEVLNIDVTSMWTSAASGSVYFAHSKNGDNWTYLKADGAGDLVDGRLLQATSKADASANPWIYSATPGSANAAKFPLGVRARYTRMYIKSKLRIYELTYKYYVIPEQFVVEYLSAITADVGLLTAGVVQSSNFADGGVKLDLDNDRMDVYDDADTLRVRIGKLV